MAGEKKPRKEKLVDHALQGGTFTLQVIKSVSQVAPAVPYLSQAAGLVLTMFEVVQTVKDNKNGFQALANDATKILALIHDSYNQTATRAKNPWPPEELKHVSEDIIQTMSETIQLGSKNKARHIISRAISNKADIGKIGELRQRMQSSLELFKVQSHLTTNHKLSELSELITLDAENKRVAALSRRAQVMKELRKRSHPGAGCDAKARSDVPKCLPETREAIIEHIKNWIENGAQSSTFLWMYGPAGCGKTTIAQTIALLYQSCDRLLASFFFSRSAGDARPSTKSEFVITVAFQLCISIPDLVEHVAAAIDDDAGIFDRDLSTQIQALVIEPLNHLLKDQTIDDLETKRWWLLLVDGLDECEGADAQKEVLKLLSVIIRDTSLPLRILVASRPEHAIHNVIMNGASRLLPAPETIPLHVDYKTIDDIRKYILSRFDHIKLEHTTKSFLPADWPEDNVVKELVDRSHGLFIYASLVMKYIESEDDHPQERLQEIIESSTPAGADSSDLPFAQLDAMYAFILSRIPTRNRQKVQDFLYSLIYGESMRSLASYEFLFDLKPGGARTLLNNLAAVLNVPSDDFSELRFVHASFGDFLQDPARAGLKSPDFLCVPNDAHGRLAQAWFQFFPKYTSSKSFDGNLPFFNLKISNLLGGMLHHCRNTDRLHIFQDAVQKFDVRPILVKDLYNKSEIWQRIYYCVEFLLWLRKQKYDRFKDELYNQHYHHVQNAVHAYWSQFPPEVQSFVPILLNYNISGSLEREEDLNRTLLSWRWCSSEIRTFLSELLAAFSSEATAEYLKDKIPAVEVVVWVANTLQLEPADSTHAYFNFFAPNRRLAILAIIIEQAPANHNLETFIRSQDQSKWVVSEDGKEDISLRNAKVTVAKAIEDYYSKCRNAEHIQQAQIVEPLPASGSMGGENLKAATAHDVADIYSSPNLITGKPDLAVSPTASDREKIIFGVSLVAALLAYFLLADGIGIRSEK